MFVDYFDFISESLVLYLIVHFILDYNNFLNLISIIKIVLLKKIERLVCRDILIYFESFIKILLRYIEIDLILNNLYK